MAKPQPVLETTTPQWNNKSTTFITNLSPMQKNFVGAGIIAAIILLIAIVNVASWKQGTLFILGLLLGATLLYARFGFTSAFRRFVSVGNVQGIQAHLLMFVVSTTLFALILVLGSLLPGEHHQLLLILSALVSSLVHFYSGSGCSLETDVHLEHFII